AHEHEVADALETSPEGLGTWFAIVLAAEEAAEARDHANHLIEPWGFLRRFLAFGDDVDRVPLLGGEHDLAGEIGAGAAEPSEEEHAPGDDEVKRDGELEAIGELELKVLDLAAALEDAEEDL